MDTTQSNLMDGNPAFLDSLLGIVDKTFGSEATRADFGVDAYNPREGFIGVIDTLNVISFGLSTGKGTGGTGAGSGGGSGAGGGNNGFGYSEPLAITPGKPIWLNANAAGWDWFYPTPWDDSEFTAPGAQGGQLRMGLMTMPGQEVAHFLGYHDADGVMAEPLIAGTRPAASHGLEQNTSELASDALFALLAADGETTWIGSSLFGRGRLKR